MSLTLTVWAGSLWIVNLLISVFPGACFLGEKKRSIPQ
eukprot:SAG25_NODE_5669_length_633_cov_1.052434_1_plen_37_part_10